MVDHPDQIRLLDAYAGNAARGGKPWSCFIKVNGGGK
jgi:hypothetical protein